MLSGPAIVLSGRRPRQISPTLPGMAVPESADVERPGQPSEAIEDEIETEIELGAVGVARPQDMIDGEFAEVREGLGREPVEDHEYMSALPAFFYPSFQLMDYAVHSWTSARAAAAAMVGTITGDMAVADGYLNLFFWI
jgi:hypothetical protein